MTRSRRALGAVVATALVIAGVVLTVVAIRAQQSAPQPAPDQAGRYALQSDSASRTAAGPSSRSGSSKPDTSSQIGAEHHGPILPEARPTRLRIPAIGVDSSIMKLGLNPDHTIQVPPLSAHSRAGWYRYSPSPGQLGPSVILGHIDSAKFGPGVFFKLGDLHKGDSIQITRADHRVAVFRVNAVAEYPKSRFPRYTVYGNTDDAALRLITCGGKFDSSAGSYEDNIVAFAHLVSSHRS